MTQAESWGLLHFSNLMHTPNAYDYPLLLLYAFVCVCIFVHKFIPVHS